MFSSNRRQLRRWAERVLLLWVFGLSSGVASACWAGNMARLEGLQLPPAVAVKAVQGDGALPECALHSGVHPQDDAGTGGHEHSGAKTICNAYCDMSALSVSPLKSSLDHSPGPALPAPAYTFALTIPAESPVHLRKPRREGWLAPPITIAFLRLTL